MFLLFYGEKLSGLFGQPTICLWADQPNAKVGGLQYLGEGAKIYNVFSNSAEGRLGIY